MTPAYGYICLSCGQLFSADNAYAKHSDPETGAKCRDVTGSSSVPTKISPIADRTWGPEGAIAEARWEATYDHGYKPPPYEHQVEMLWERLNRISAISPRA